jgi:hypothetical protein
MCSIKLDINDKIYEKVMFFSENIPKQDLTIKEIKNFEDKLEENNLVDFFRKSPLVGEVEIKRDSYINE